MTFRRAHQLALVECAPWRPTTDGAADAAVAAWRGIEATLVPLVGRLGFVALYLRCIALRGKKDARLQKAHEGVRAWDDFAALHAALRARSGPEAAAAHRELLLVLHEVLTSLLGGPLVDKLLPPIEQAAP